MEFIIHNVEFLECFNYFDKNKHPNTYKYIEKLLYSENVDKQKKMLLNMGVEKFTLDLLNKIKENQNIKTLSKKIIKENFLEDYVIENNNNIDFLNNINIKLFFKIITSKNFVVENDKIVKIV